MLCITTVLAESHTDRLIRPSYIWVDPYDVTRVGFEMARSGLSTANLLSVYECGIEEVWDLRVLRFLRFKDFEV